MKKLGLALYVLGSVIALVACSRQAAQVSTPPDPEQTTTPPPVPPAQAPTPKPQPPPNPTATVVAKSGPTVLLRWDASNGAKTYYLYRADFVNDSCGSYIKLGGGTLNTSWEDYGKGWVVSGKTYCYAVTQVNADNVESAKSDVAIILIP